MTTETEHDTFQALIYHVSMAAEHAKKFSQLRNDRRWEAVGNGLLEMKDKLYKLSESIAAPNASH